MKLSQFGLHRNKRGDIGIEIEVEGEEQLTPIESDWWASKKEDSLRFYGMEYVTTRPLNSGQEVRDAVDYICKIINKKKIVKDTNRTSIHTHHNMTKRDIRHVLNGVCVFWIVENVLARYCGEDRESNLFCMRLKDAEAVLDETIKQLDQRPPLMMFGKGGDTVRYAGLNLGALRNYGSLEVRLKQGTTDPEEIIEWAEAMHELFCLGESWKDPSEFFDWYVYNGSKKLLERIFAEKFATKLRDRVPNYKNLMEENAILVSELAYAKDWDEWVAQLAKGDYAKPMKTDYNYNHAYQPITTSQIQAGIPITFTTSHTGTASNV